MKYIKCMALSGSLVIALLSIGCSSGSSSSSLNEENAPKLVNYVSSFNVNAVDGVNDIVVMEYTDTSNNSGTAGFDATLNIYKQNPVDKNTLLIEGSVNLGVGTLYKRTSNINTNSEWVAITLNHNFSDSGWVALVSLTKNPTYKLDLLLDIPQTLSKSAATGDWLLAVYGNTLALYDISDIITPVLNQNFPLSSDVTNIACLSNGCYLFSKNSYYYLDLSNSASINIIEIVDNDLKNIMKSYISGTSIMLAGPSNVVGNTRVAKVNVDDPFNPVTEIIKNDITGDYIEFAFDQGAGFYYVVTSSTLYKYQEDNIIFSEVSTAPITATSLTNKMFHAYSERQYDGNGEGGPGITIWEY